MLPLRLALALLLAVVMSPVLLRPWLETPPPVRACAPEGRGDAPRHWLGCAADGGPRRALAPDERLFLGLPIDPNTASARELAFVPGLGHALAEEVVREREQNGPFLSTDDLLRVRGIGPRRLALAGPALAPGAPAVAAPTPAPWRPRRRCGRLRRRSGMEVRTVGHPLRTLLDDVRARRVAPRARGLAGPVHPVPARLHGAPSPGGRAGARRGLRVRGSGGA
jgi:competence protein ComEA